MPGLNDPNGPADEATEEEGSAEEGDKRGRNFVYPYNSSAFGSNRPTSLPLLQVKYGKEALEQSSKRLRDESAQFNAEQYKLGVC